MKRLRKDNAAPAHNHGEFATADGQFNVSQSKVKVYRACRRQFYWKFVKMLRRKKIKRPLMFGDLAHKIVEAEAEGQDWEKLLENINLEKGKLFKREIEMYGNIIEDLHDIMTDYFAFYDEGNPNYIKPIKHDGRRSEHEFRIELAKGLWFTGKIDMIGKARKMRWLVEHKTFSRLPSEDERWRSVQAAVYFRALEHMGFEQIDGVLWDYISSKPCNVPGELTKTGKISQAKIDSLPSRIHRWRKEQGLKRSEVAKLIEDAEANRRNRFIRLFSPIKRPIVNMVWEDFVDTAKEMVEFYGKKKDQNIGRHCSWCDYQELCKAEATGSDVDWLIERNYELEDLSHKSEMKDRTED